MKIRTISLIAVFVILFSLESLACGDSLYRVGKGVSYRVYTAPLPGSVLVYGDTEGAKQLAEALARSGHGVRLVQNQEELSEEMQRGGYDVVIAPYSDHTAIEAAGSAADATTTFLPVAMNEEEKRQAQQSYKRVMVAQDDELKHYLKAIHKTLKQNS